MAAEDFADTLPRLAPDAVDEELLALPAPPRGRRLVAIALMAVVVVLASALFLKVRDDIGFYFSGAEQARDLGEVTALSAEQLVDNSHVRVRGTPMWSRMVRFERSLSGTTYVVFPLAGQRQVFVQLPEHALSDPRYVARGEFSGRLTTFGSLGARFRPVRDYMARALDMPVTAQSSLLLAGESPRRYGWAVALGAVCLVLIALNVWLMARWFRSQG